MANELKSEQTAQAVSLLCEDLGIRAIERIIGIHRDTIKRAGAGARTTACAGGCGHDPRGESA